MNQLEKVKKAIIDDGVDNDIVNTYLDNLMFDIGHMDDGQWEYFPKINLSDEN